VHSLNLIYPALLLRNVLRNLLQNIDHVKMLYVNLCNLFYCFFFFCVCWFLLYFLFSSFYHIMMNKDVYINKYKPFRLQRQLQCHIEWCEVGTGRWWVGCYIWYMVQREGDWAGPQPAQAPHRCTKCNTHQRPVYQSPYCCIYRPNGPFICGFNVPIKG